MKIKVSGKLWDVAKYAAELDRHTFLCAFVARKTRSKEDRSVVGNLQVVQKTKGWTYVHHLGRKKVQMSSPDEAASLYDMIRRTPLNYYVRQAEDYRDAVLGDSGASV